MPKFSNPFEKFMTRTKKSPEKAETPVEMQTTPPQTTQTVSGSPVYLKALPLRDLEDVDSIKQEVKDGNILILKVSPLARKSVDDVKTAVSQLLEFTQGVGGDIARLGEERVVITPSSIRIWREKTPASGGALPTAA